MLRVLCSIGLLLAVTACFGGRTDPVPAPAPVATRPAPVVETPPPRDYGPRPRYTSPRDAAIEDADLDALWARQMMVPVEGVSRSSLRDTFEAKRGDRIHGALDLMAPRYTAVLAADDCVIGRLVTGDLGGIVIYATDPTEQFVYYYAHLHRYRRGLAVGDRVAKGSILGYVGTTGNAPPNAPHLHFQVMKRGTGGAWWDGPAINPLPFFASDGVRF